MQIELKDYFSKNQTVAVAVSGGSDSMALLHYMQSNAVLYGINIVALNVEHGIRGEASVKDSEFVRKYCKRNGIVLIEYKVDSLLHAQNNKLSVEQSARELRYGCFFDAINSGKCDKVATAHHLRDNAESVLLNIFRGTGIKGLKGINAKYSDKIVRPLLTVDKVDIEKYIINNKIPFVTDETNLSDDYTRNYIRLNVMPKIKEIFPEVEKSISRLSSIACIEDEFMDQTARSYLSISNGVAQILIPPHRAIFNRVVIIALKELGLEKDWQKVHVDSIYSLCNLENGSEIVLPKRFTAIKEYDKIIITEKKQTSCCSIPFSVGEIDFDGNKLSAQFVQAPIDLKDGLFLDVDKIPQTAVVRYKEDGDVFTKFGGGTKKLNDYFTDVKIPLRLRASTPVIATGNVVLAVFGVAISEKVKVDNSTKKIIKITKEERDE